ncbi:response regulator [Alkalicella caledoniensis]|uniref:Stage 0 sporulation protein A homolog n=1 Tax=Alkalicella caledoniensis TaxID=2731377 RepID=A0A7G9W5R5_ALKCA|nr:response regulator [Alkalicella caledoniensis]QNO14027.1 response regulator [Alkalicella caledoniensis]
MIKLLIADDEHIVIQSIKFIIHKFLDDVEVVGSASSGREAIEKALDLKPDIILMDIHIPGINGIEAIRQIKNSYNDAEFVIISAYEYFQYAKDAVNLGVYEYITKPVNKYKLVNVINDLSQIIYSKKEALKKEMILMEKMNTIIPHLESQFIHSLLFNSNTVDDLSFYEEIFGMKLRYGYAMVATVKNHEACTKTDTISISLLKQKFYDMFSMQLKNICPCLIGPPLLDRVVAFIPMDEKTDAYDLRNISISYANKLGEKIARNVKIPFEIGIGKGYNIELFTKSYKEASKSVNSGKGETVTHFEDFHGVLAQQDNYPIHKEKLYLDKLSTGDLKGVLEIFEELFLWLTANNPNDVNKIKSKLIELIIISQRTVNRDVQDDSLLDSEFLIQLLSIDDPNEIKLNYMNYLKNLLVNVEEKKSKKLNGFIIKALEYIDENYQHNLTLDDVAKEISMSYHHFSKFFKESTGKNFVDYITELRIEKAKMVLKDKNANVKEACYEVGYTDPNYFSKLFKKATGMTPTEYRANSISRGVM